MKMFTSLDELNKISDCGKWYRTNNTTSSLSKLQGRLKFGEPID